MSPSRRRATPATPGPARTRQERSADTAAALKDAARTVFAERGYLNTKITDITAAAGRSAGSFYNHFADKEELLDALFADLAAWGDRLVHEPGSTHDPDFGRVAAVRWHVALAWRFHRENAPVLRALRQAALVNTDVAERLRRFHARERADLEDHMRRIDGSNGTLPGRADAAVDLMFGILETAAEQWLDPAGRTRMDDEDAVAMLTRFVYRGLTGRDG